MFDGLTPFTNCTILSTHVCTVPLHVADEGDRCEADGGDLCEADDGKLATARSRTPQLPPCFSEASHVTKTFFFLAASMLRVEKLQLSLDKSVILLRWTKMTFAWRTAVN